MIEKLELTRPPEADPAISSGTATLADLPDIAPLGCAGQPPGCPGSGSPLGTS